MTHKKDMVLSPGGNPLRRRTLASLVGLALGGGLTSWGPASRGATRPLVRMGFTPAFVHDQHALLADWRAYMERRLGFALEFKQRDSYRETMDLLRLRQIDFAWVCDYPYLHLRDLVRLLAVPLYKGRPYYRSFVIVAAGNKAVTGLKDLKNSVFAYADPLSNTGYLSPRYALRRMGEDPQHFFRKTFFTWSHKKVVEAVARGMAQGGAVDSYIWETLDRIDPALTRRTRIVERSPEYGFPPFVAHRDVAPALFEQMQNFMLTMHQDPEGAAILGRLYLDGFTRGEPGMYDGVAEMMRAFGEL
jgi:phosphonate transport system substrate-binding protein